MRTLLGIGLLLATGVSTGFTQQGNSTAAGAGTALTLSSTAFASGAEIPKQHACKGGDSSPPLEWKGGPSQVVGYALIMDDPDAPGGLWTHWVMWSLPASAHGLPEGVPKNEQLEDGTRQGRNSFHKAGYNGPCPPGGQTHRYFFRLYALDTKIELSPTASRSELEAAMKGHTIAQAEYMGTFHR